jgi:hypothetical protein
VVGLKQTNEFRRGHREKEREKKKRRRRGEGGGIQDEGGFRGPRVEGEGPAAAATATAGRVRE